MAARTNPNPSGWTTERVELLKKLWADGLSAGQIAKELGGITRNSAIGKAHRLGLPRRAAPSMPGSRAEERRTKPRLRTAPAYIAPPGKPLPAPKLTGLEPTATLESLTARACKFPIGDPGEPGFGFCGRLKPLDEPYCPTHRAVAWAGHQQERTEAQKAGDAKRRATFQAKLAKRFAA